MAERTRICCLKYSLMACNAFGIMLGIFVVLFGVSYPDVDFPGGYKGKTTAGISGVFIFFTLIGYCGAHHQKAYFLIIYAVIIFIFIFGNIITFVWIPEQTVFDINSRTFWIVSGVLFSVQLIACILAWKVWRSSNSSSSSNHSATTATTTTATTTQHGTILKTSMQPSSSTSFMMPRFGPMSLPKGY
ncbi:hypothetical protein B4U79_02093 [Dinothrombium tinctorium]|uniref:Uncharacterized protein n=1 Tax=Dinothrombium tinctorium TaxID=1965070 RepID=A0A443QW24_9ACAR|nr:hypothetical protein B4U79_02093 [Dinothrombium tinctorium]